MGKVDIKTLTMEQYLDLDRGDTRNENEDAHEHVGRILEIASLFNTLGVLGDAVMLQVFPLTLTRKAKRWLDRAPSETINTWDLLKRIFILRFCPPSKTSRQLEEIHKFKQEGREALYQAWERYNDLLFKCPTHDLNDYQKVNTFYKGLEIPTRQIEEVKCVKATESREDSLMVTLGNNSPSGNMPKLEETLGKYLEESCKRQDIFDEWMKRFRENTDKNLRRHDFAIKGLKENVVRLAQAVFTHKKLNQDMTLDMKRNTIISPLSVNSNLVHCINSIEQEIIKKIGEKDGSPQETPTKELGTFCEKVKRRIIEEQEKGERLLESLEKEPVNTPLVNPIRQTPDYTKCLQELVVTPSQGANARHDEKGNHHNTLESIRETKTCIKIQGIDTQCHENTQNTSIKSKRRLTLK
ncbi:homeodomain-like protein [Tanacetum coccineum]